MSDRYIDPNSGAAPQPGGYAGSAPVLKDPKKATASTAPEADPKKADKAEARAAKKAVSAEVPRHDTPSEGRGGAPAEQPENADVVAPADRPAEVETVEGGATAEKGDDGVPVLKNPPAKKAAAKKAPAKKAPAKKAAAKR